jgi:hypothetical protein
VTDSQTKTQRAKILRLLLEAKGRELPAFGMARLALQYSARIHELRKLGFDIQNRSETVKGQRRSWFRLAMTPVSTQRDNQRTVSQAGLFGDLSVEHNDQG